MKIFTPQKLFGIIGHPLGHSLSPLIHNWGFGVFGLANVYMRWPVEPAGLAGLLAGVRAMGVEGLSVTIPHKTAVMEYLDECDELALRVGAVNTLYWEEGRLCGTNTDVEGFLAPLHELGEMPQSALVLGAGGAARAVVAGLVGLGIGEIAVTNRDPLKARALSEEFGCRFVKWDYRAKTAAGLVVNTTPLGMQGLNEGLSPWPEDCFEPGQVAYDLVYAPRETRFLREAASRGCVVLGGLEMFLAQAAAQFRIWTGLELPREGARELLEAGLG